MNAQFFFLTIDSISPSELQGIGLQCVVSHCAYDIVRGEEDVGAQMKWKYKSVGPTIAEQERGTMRGL